MERPLVPLEALRAVPKAELHRHLDGSVRVETVVELACLAAESGDPAPLAALAEAVAAAEGTTTAVGVEDESGTYRSTAVAERKVLVERLRPLICVTGECESLEQYLRGFGLTLRVLQTPRALTRAMLEVAQDAAADGVRYLEVRFSPVLHTEGGMSLAAIVEAVLEGVRVAEYSLQIMVKIIICGMRHLPPSTTKSLAEIAWRYRLKGVIGFDLAGPEDGFSSRHHREAFDVVHNKLLNCTLHSGEAYGPDSIKDSIRFCGAHRLGHGTRLFQDPVLQQYVADHDIVVECCLTSNLQTKAVRSLTEHPIRRYFDAGIIVVPCCDNTTVSNVTLSGEYDLLQRTESLKFTPLELLKCVDNSFLGSFLDDGDRQRFRAEALRLGVRAFREHGVDLTEFTNAKGDERTSIDLWLESVGVSFHQLFSPKIALSNSLSHHPASVPTLTVEDIRALPKADLHVRLIGSVSIRALWKEIELASIDLSLLGHLAPTSLNELELLVQQHRQKTEDSTIKTDKKEASLSHNLKHAFRAALQDEGQLRRAVDDIFDTAKEDGVAYMELVVRPAAHTHGKLSEREAVEHILAAVAANKLRSGIVCGVVLYASTRLDGPPEFARIAKLAADDKLMQAGVCGFGVFGAKDIPQDRIAAFQSTFDYLKKRSVDVVMFAGKSDDKSVISALHIGGASRISGAFVAHQYPRLIQYLSAHNIPVELALSKKLQRYTADVEQFAGPHALRLFIDHGLVVSLCSFRGTMESRNRVNMIHELVQSCNMNPAEVIGLLRSGFMSNFMPLTRRKLLWVESRTRALAYLVKRGFPESALSPHSFFADEPQIPGYCPE